MSKSVKHQYRHPHPAVAVDIVVFTIRGESLNVLLVNRGVEPFLGKWALPGGFVHMDEDLLDAARRELLEETGVENAYLEQCGAFGRPDRDPRERVISVAYYSILASDTLKLRAGTDASETSWFPLETLPDLAFDHADIITHAHSRLSDKLRRSTIALQFLPQEFTLSQLQAAHEIILCESIDKRNFRKWVKTLSYIKSTGKKQQGTQHRPAELYMADPELPVQSVDSLPQARRSRQIDDDDERLDIYRKGYQEGIDKAHAAFVEAYRSLKKTSA